MWCVWLVLAYCWSRQWPSIVPVLVQCIVFAGLCIKYQPSSLSGLQLIISGEISPTYLGCDLSHAGHCCCSYFVH